MIDSQGEWSRAHVCVVCAPLVQDLRARLCACEASLSSTESSLALRTQELAVAHARVCALEASMSACEEGRERERVCVQSEREEGRRALLVAREKAEESARRLACVERERGVCVCVTLLCVCDPAVLSIPTLCMNSFSHLYY